MSVGLLILRLVVGLGLAAHGAQKLFGWFGGYGIAGTAQFFEQQLGFRPGRLHAVQAGLAETLGGLFLAAGFLTPVAAAALVAVMLVAAVSVHLKGFFAASGGYEYTLVLAAAAVALAFTGPGAISLDHALGISWSGEKWGLGALAAGLIGGAVPLLARKQPVTSAAPHTA